jgi:hypothetical protein
MNMAKIELPLTPWLGRSITHWIEAEARAAKAKGCGFAANEFWWHYRVGEPFDADERRYAILVDPATGKRREMHSFPIENSSCWGDEAIAWTRARRQADRTRKD